MATLIKPGLYRIEGLPWAWVRMGDLAQLLDITPASVWKNYFLLSKDVDILAVVYDCWGAGTMWNIGIEGEVSGSWNGDYWQYALGGKEAFDHALSEGDIYVPAGFAMAVLEAHEKGAVVIVTEEHSHLGNGEPCPEGTLNCTFNGHGFTAAVGLDIDGNPIWTYAECAHSEGTETVGYLNPCSSAGCDHQSGEHRNCGQQYREVCVRCGATISDTADELN